MLFFWRENSSTFPKIPIYFSEIQMLIFGAKIQIFLLRKLMLKNELFLVKVIKEKYNETLLVIFKHCDIIVHKLCSILQGHSHTQSQL